MHMGKVLSVLAIGSAGAAAAAAPVAGSKTNEDCDKPGKHCKLTTRDLEHVADKYLHIWGTGDFSTVNTTMSPNVVYYQDVFPTGQGNGSVEVPVHNSQQWIDFVNLSRDGFTSYAFAKRYTLSQDFRIAIRWTLQAYANATGATQELTKGTFVSYNGTDILYINKCSKLIEQVDSAQDFIRFYSQLRIPIGTV